jgi:uncharacterized membrane protein
MAKLNTVYRRLTRTLWFVPTILTACGVFLGFLLVSIDRYVGYELKYYPRLFDVEAAGSRDMLSVIAGSMITVAGTVFSITIVALTLASTQFSPRILRNFIRDTGNQSVLGVFVGIFAYCVVVLRTIRDGNGAGDDFVPSLAVVFAFLLGLTAIGFLIYHIHHIASSIQASNIVYNIAEETIEVIGKLYQDSDSKIDAKTLLAIENELEAKDWQSVTATKNGYIQAIDYKDLLALVERNDLILRVKQGVGEFTVVGEPLFEVSGASINQSLTAKLLEDFEIDSFRTIEQDPAFGVRQIVDIALKALSPAINDTTTGMTCVDYLTAILSSFVQHSSGSPFIFINGKLRLVTKQQRFEDLFDLAFNAIRQNASGNVGLLVRMMNSLEILGAMLKKACPADEIEERRLLIQRKLENLGELAERTILETDDLELVRRALIKAQTVVNK